MKRKPKAIPIPPLIKRKVIVGVYEVTDEGKVTGYNVRCIYQNYCRWNGVTKPTFLEAIQAAHRHGAECKDPVDRWNDTTLVAIITTNT